MIKNTDKTRLAIIDVGTLKSKFEIREFDASEKSHVLYKDKKLTVLGRDLQKTGKIIEESVTNTIEALKEFKEKMDDYGVTRYEAITTEAVRKAANAAEVLERIARETGITLRVLTHDDEARILFHHVAKSFSGKRIAVADIGGGSVQLVIGKDGIVEHPYLFKTGTYFMQEELAGSHHPTAQEVEKARKYIRKAFSELAQNDMKVDELIYGSTNIINFMKAVQVPLVPSGYDRPHIYRATRTDLEALFEKIITLSYEDRMPMFADEPYYMWSADNALLNVFGFMDALKIESTIPTNANISSGLFDELIYPTSPTFP
jgi:exopolyphosphatase/guanosine-5'-triphosphate,3'-diphosphate pyrophosphatase